MQFAVIVENDISQWSDDMGVRYHFPRRYRNKLAPGTRLIHYKGRMLDRSFAAQRMSPEPHYFGTSIAGEHAPDEASSKGDLFVAIQDFQTFPNAVPIRSDGTTLEHIPESRRNNHWRDGVRAISDEIYVRILQMSGLQVMQSPAPATAEPPLITVTVEGQKRYVLNAAYERSPQLRKTAVKLHGTRCFACEIDLAERYGEVAKDFIHIHHKKPLCVADGPIAVDAALDLVPLCPNCHAIVHIRGALRSVNNVRAMLGKSSIPLGE